MMGGNVSFSENKTQYKNEDLSSNHGLGIVISPDIGYFVIDKLGLGINGYYSIQSYTNGDGSKATSSIYGLGPFIKYYLLPMDNVINIAVGSSYQHQIFHPHSPPENIYSFFAGPSFFFNSSVAMEFLAGFDYTKSSDESTRTFKLNIGFQIYLEK